MKSLKTFTFILVLSIQFIGFSQENKLNLIKEKFHSSFKEQNVGAAILIKKEGKTEYLSLGNFNLTENSIFNIGSATKTFTAVLLLQEIEKGNLKLTDSIGSYLTPITNVDGGLTIEALMKHESGLDEVIEGNTMQEIFYSKNDSLYTIPLLFQVERNDPKMVGKFNYCNTNYLLLGKILEKLTDQNYFDLLRERIFIPLQMNKTYPYLHKNLQNLATPIHDNKDVSQFLDYRFFANIASSAGSIASTLLDMEKFYIALFEKELLLKKQTVAMMMESGNEVYGYGLFKFINGKQKYYGHGGNNFGYAFRNEYNPVTKNMYLIFSNTTRMPNGAIRNDLLTYINSDENKNDTETDIIIPISILDSYSGKYELAPNRIINVTRDGNRIFIQLSGQQKIEIFASSTIKFYLKVVGATVTFNIDDKGKVVSLTINQNGRDNLGKKLE